MEVLQIPGVPELLVVVLLAAIFLAVILALLGMFRRVAVAQSSAPSAAVGVNESGDGTSAPSEAPSGRGSRGRSPAADVDDAALRDELPPATRLVIDQVAAASLVLIGLGLTLAGGGLFSAADYDDIRRLVAEGVIESTVLPDDLLAEIVFNASLWGGVGVAASGLLAVVAGVVFGGYLIRRDAAETGPDAVSNALVGAVVSVITISIPFSIVLGGVVAGYLQQRTPWAGFRIGLLAGLFVAIPTFLILGTIIAGVVLAGLPVVGLLLFFGLVFTLTYTILLSGIGGYVGGYLAHRP